MNRIYKVIWSKVKNCYVVVSEIAKRNSKSTVNSGFSVTRNILAGAVVLGLTAGVCAPVGAFTYNEVVTFSGNNAAVDTVISPWEGIKVGNVVEISPYSGIKVNGKTIVSNTGDFGTIDASSVNAGDLSVVNGTNQLFKVDNQGILTLNNWNGDKTISISAASGIKFGDTTIIDSNGKISSDALPDFNITKLGKYHVSDTDGTTLYVEGSTATGQYAKALGNGTSATGEAATAFGVNSVAHGQDATAFGSGSKAYGAGATAFGYNTKAAQYATDANGYITTVSGNYVTLDGYEAYHNGTTTYKVENNQHIKLDVIVDSNNNIFAIDTEKHTDGTYQGKYKKYKVTFDDDGNAILNYDMPADEWNPVTYTGGDEKVELNEYINATAFGQSTLASEDEAVAFGNKTVASGRQSTAFGEGTIAKGKQSTAWGNGSVASNDQATAFGQNTEASGPQSTAWGNGNKATNTDATAWGKDNVASGEHSTAWGQGTEASADQATAFGYHTHATANHATAWGQNTEASAQQATAFGYNTKATADHATAWGQNTEASAQQATAFGYNTKATAEHATAFGLNTRATGAQSLAFGEGNVATGDASGDPATMNGVAAAKNSLAALGGSTYKTASDSAAIGLGAKTTAPDTIALGSGSVAGAMDQTNGLYKKDSISTAAYVWQPQKNNVSVGDPANGISRRITGVAAGLELTDAVNVAQLRSVVESAISGDVQLDFAGDDGTVITKKNGEQLDVIGGKAKADLASDKNIGVYEEGGKLNINLAKDVKGVDNITVNNNVKVGGNTVINGDTITTTNITGDTVNTKTINLGDDNSKTTITYEGDRIKYGDNITVATLDDGMKYGGDIGKEISKKLGEQVNVVGGITDESKLTAEDNIGVVSDEKDNLKVRLAKDINLGDEGSVTIGDTKVTNNNITVGGTTITNNSVTTTDVNATNITATKTFKAGDVFEVTENGDVTYNRTDYSKAGDTTVVNKKYADSLGWNLQENGTQKDKVVNEDTVNFVNGEGTKVTIETADGKTSAVRVDLDKDIISEFTSIATDNRNVGLYRNEEGKQTIVSPFLEMEGVKDASAANKEVIEKYEALEAKKKQLEADGEDTTEVEAQLSALEADYAKAKDLAVTFAQATGTGSIALGKSSQATADGAIALGTASQATAVNAVAMGSYAEATGRGSLSVGRYSKAQSAYSTALGIRAAVGSNAKNSIAIGREVTVGEVLKDDQKPSGKLIENSVAIGKGSTVTGSNSIAIGTGHQVGGNNSGAIGDPNVVNADNSYTVGNNSTIEKGADDSFVFGNNRIVKGKGSVVAGSATEDTTTEAANSVVIGYDANVELADYESVALGSGAKADRLGGYGKTAANDITVGNLTFSSNAFAGTGSDVAGTVSVGSARKTRTLTYVGAGEISATSTDAINGSQLYSAIEAMQFDIVAGDNVEVVKDKQNGKTVYTIHSLNAIVEEGPSGNVTVTPTTGEGGTTNGQTTDLTGGATGAEGTTGGTAGNGRGRTAAP